MTDEEFLKKYRPGGWTGQHLKKIVAYILNRQPRWRKKDFQWAEAEDRTPRGRIFKIIGV
jgi:hypothetical protein